MKGLNSRTKDILKRKAPTILTCIAGAGVVVTSALTVKGTIKAVKIIEEMEDANDKKAIVKAVAPSYIPAIISGGLTISAIFAANGLNKKQYASLVGAYGLLAGSYKEYKAKVEDLYGKEVDIHIKKEIAEDVFSEEPIEIDENKQLFFDIFSGRYFESTMEEVLKAEYYVNRDAAVYGGSSLNYFYAAVGLEELPEYEELGWSAAQVYDMSWHSWIEFKNDKVIMEDGMECVLINMITEPFPGYLDY